MGHERLILSIMEVKVKGERLLVVGQFGGSAIEPPLLFLFLSSK
jgi:hypothetical protein